MDTKWVTSELAWTTHPETGVSLKPVLPPTATGPVGSWSLAHTSPCPPLLPLLSEFHSSMLTPGRWSSGPLVTMRVPWSPCRAGAGRRAPDYLLPYPVPGSEALLLSCSGKRSVVTTRL